jgi:hypothetical protein
VKAETIQTESRSSLVRSWQVGHCYKLDCSADRAQSKVQVLFNSDGVCFEADLQYGTLRLRLKRRQFR